MICLSRSHRLVVLACVFAMFAGNLTADRIQPHLEAHRAKLSAASSSQLTPDGPTTDWCLTKDEFIKQTFIWTISNFSHLAQNVGQEINSTIFPAGPDHNYKWKLILYPKGRDGAHDGYVSTDLMLVDHEPKDEIVKAKFKMVLLDDQNKPDKTMDSGGLNEFAVGGKWGFDNFINRGGLFNQPARLLPADQLTISCEVQIFVGTRKYSGQLAKQTMPESRLADDFGQLFESQKYSDMIIVVAGREFKVHKAVLSARSVVFAAMFEHDMKENQLSRVDINDMEPDVFEELLRFIYTGKCVLESRIYEEQQEGEQLDKDKEHILALELMEASAKYQLDRLKVICEHRLYQDISVDSVVDVLTLADRYEAKLLKDKAIEFITEHAPEVLKTEAWTSLIRENPAVVGEVQNLLICRALGMSKEAASDERLDEPQDERPKKQCTIQ